MTESQLSGESVDGGSVDVSQKSQYASEFRHNGIYSMIPTHGGATNGGATFRGLDNDNDIQINQKIFMDVSDEDVSY